MSNDALLLTLGHNSSAIYVVGNEIVCGYENERLSHRKADSTFPLEAILEIRKNYLLSNDIDIYISHWFINPNKPLEEQGKWYDHRAIKTIFPNSNIISLDKDFTHHDAHAFSVDCFAGRGMPVDTHTIVADGFGSYGETLSIYGPGMQLLNRSFGFSSSLGLIYQYATSFLGLKENQDEYKLLGYEAHINEIGLDVEQLATIYHSIDKEVENMMGKIFTHNLDPKYDPLISIDALPALKSHLRKKFKTLIDIVDVDKDIYKERVIIAFFVQSVIEIIMVKIIGKYEIKNLALAGGIFLNVKLNNEIAQELKGLLTIMPLSGDQGAAIGLYHSHNRLNWPNHLYWGDRELNDIIECEGLFFTDDPDFIVRQLANGNIVNVVRGSMEYGSRALCHTSTLALPDSANVEYINNLNGRDTIMPMAPVMKESSADGFFQDANKIYKSLEYMVCARDCNDDIDPSNYGVTHKSPISGIRTCRPQLIYNDPFMESILDVFGYLINTSFNEHGTPIVYDMSDIYRCHNYQLARDGMNKLVTVVVKEQ